MQSTNEILQDLITTRSLFLERVKGNFSNQIAKLYSDLFDDVEKKILSTDVDMAKLNQLIKEINRNLTVPFADIGNQLIELAQDENKFTAKALNDSIGVNIAQGLASAKIVEKVATQSLIEGALLKDWFSSLNASLQFDIDREIKLGFTQGETTKEIRDRLQNRFKINAKNADSVILTATSTIANNIRESVYQENKSLFSEYVHASVLDSRTTKNICAIRDGKRWDFATKKPINHSLTFILPPLHRNCRSTMLPIVKGWKELEKEFNIPEATRSSLTGQVPQSLDFKDWFNKQTDDFKYDYLGKERFDLYKKNKLNFVDFFNNKGNYLTVKQLKAKYEA